MKTRFFIIPAFFLISALFFNCPSEKAEEDEKPDNVYAIGETGPSGVGIVFYITDGGLHGLEAAPSLWKGGTEDPMSAWITGSSAHSTLNGNTLTSIGSGLANSNAIIAQAGHTGSAAKLCRDYTGGGMNDWFLPSKDEIAQLYAQRIAVGGFADWYYWSSSEADASSAALHYFNDGGQGNNGKTISGFVRAVRAF